MRGISGSLLAIVAATATLLLACGGGDAKSEVAGVECADDALSQVTTPVEVTFWHSMPANNGVTLQRLTDEFNASQDQVHVSLVFQGNYIDSLNKYLTVLRGGELPDLFQSEDTATQLLIDSGAVVPVGPCLAAEGYDTSDHLERVLAYYTVDGTLWPMPFNASNPVLYYNRDAFEKAGLDPDVPPATLDDVRAYSERIVASGAATHGLSIELDPWFLRQWFALAGEPFVNEANGREGRATAVSFDDDLGLELYRWLDGMIDDGLALSVGRNASGADHMLAIGSGQAAMTVGSAAAMGTMFAVLDGGGFDIDITMDVGPFPAIPGDGGVSVSGGALWISGRSTPVEQAAARRYAEFLNEPRSQAIWHEGSGYLPVRKSAIDLPQVQELWSRRPQYKVPYDQLLQGQTNVASAGPVLGPTKEVNEAIIVSWERMILEGLPPAEALDQAAEDANRAIADYNTRVGG